MGTKQKQDQKVKNKAMTMCPRVGTELSAPILIHAKSANQREDWISRSLHTSANAGTLFFRPFLGTTQLLSHYHM